MRAVLPSYYTYREREAYTIEAKIEKKRRT